MKKILVLSVLSLTLNIYGQIGINTSDPQATLDVNGNVMMRTVPTAATAPSYHFLVHDSSTNEVQMVTGNSTVNSTIAKFVDSNGLSLLSGALFAGWQKIDFNAADVPINTGNNFSATTDFYTVPSTGIYSITYEVRYGSGVLLSALNFGGTPRIGILKHTGASYTVLDQRTFSGATLPLVASIIISNTSIDSVYQLTAGDNLSFEINAGGLSLGLLGSSYAAVVVKKISD